MDPIRLVSDVSPPFLLTFALHTYLHVIFSCLAYPDSLDTPCRHRSAIHTEVLLELHDEETLRMLYGIVLGAAVRVKRYESDHSLRFLSRTHRIFPEGTSSSRSPPIFCINLSKVFIRITSSAGWASTSNISTAPRQGLEYSMRLTAGKRSVWTLSVLHISSLENRIALAPPFPGLRRFKQGRNFTQWTGDDSKALMKVCTTNSWGVIAYSHTGQ